MSHRQLGSDYLIWKKACQFMFSYASLVDEVVSHVYAPRITQQQNANQGCLYVWWWSLLCQSANKSWGSKKASPRIPRERHAVWREGGGKTETSASTGYSFVLFQLVIRIWWDSQVQQKLHPQCIRTLSRRVPIMLTDGSVSHNGVWNVFFFSLRITSTPSFFLAFIHSFIYLSLSTIYSF
jgi:hypothetical protein